MQVILSSYNGNVFTYYFSSPSFKNILLLPGFPYIPCKKEVSKIFEKMSFNTILLHYKGTWGSSSYFGEVSVQKEVRDFLNLKNKELIDAFSKNKFFINSIDYAVGFSYGGLASILSSNLFDKVVAFAPPLTLTKDEILKELENVKYIGSAFKISENFSLDINLNPLSFSNVLVVHGEEDNIVPLSKNKSIYEDYAVRYVTIKAGHYPSSYLLSISYDIVNKFLYS